MLVIILSECQGKAWPRTRLIMDRYLERVGERTWRGRISASGLESVRRRLCEIASKATSVAAHIARGRQSFELAWIVGSSAPFNESGARATYVGGAYERYLAKPRAEIMSRAFLDAIIELSGLWHDIGKANIHFQEKLKLNARIADPVRHEILSTRAFLETFRERADGKETADAAHDAFRTPFTFYKSDEKIDITPVDLPQSIRQVSWLIATHHRLPDATETFGAMEDANAFLLTNHNNLSEPTSIKINEAVLTDRILTRTESLLCALNDAPDVDWRILPSYLRLALILADRYVSKQPLDETLHPFGIQLSTAQIFANPKQWLDEHLEKVASAGSICLSDILDLADAMPALDSAGLPAAIRATAPEKYAWQNESAAAIKRLRRETNNEDCGFFGILAAATGAGKTRAAARIMATLSEKLRYVYAMPLRSLTLQAGTEYRDDLGLGPREVKTIIGDSAIAALYENRTKDEPAAHDFDLSRGLTVDGAEAPLSRGDLFDVPSFFIKHIEGDFVANRLLGTPVLVTTIDQLMEAADQKRTSWIISALRLLTSDLIIDEADSFDETDLVAIGRLVYLAGLYGRKVILSSASIPPALAIGYFNAYRDGYEAHARLFNKAGKINVGLFADAPRSSQCLHDVKDIAAPLTDFNSTIITGYALKEKTRFAEIMEPVETRDELFESIVQKLDALHARHHTVDKRSGKRFSLQLVRFAHVRDCVDFARMCNSHPFDAKTTVICYHAAQLLIVRDEIEKFLDAILKRKKKLISDDPRLIAWLRQGKQKDARIIVVASPVEEIGRDHDFDSGVLEPSSIKSIIQSAGRINRHRNKPAAEPNIFIMPTSLRAYEEKAEFVYTRPGVESARTDIWRDYRLSNRQIINLIAIDDIQPITARPRLETKGHGELADLEHRKLDDFLNGDRYFSLASFHGDRHAFLGALHPSVMQFRQSNGEIDYYFDFETERFLYLNDGKSAGADIKIADKPTIPKNGIIDLDPMRIMMARFEIDKGASTDRKAKLSKKYMRMSLRHSSKSRTYDPLLGAFISYK